MNPLGGGLAVSMLGWPKQDLAKSNHNDDEVHFQSGLAKGNHLRDESWQPFLLEQRTHWCSSCKPRKIFRQIDWYLCSNALLDLSMLNRFVGLMTLYSLKEMHVVEGVLFFFARPSTRLARRHAGSHDPAQMAY